MQWTIWGTNQGRGLRALETHQSPVDVTYHGAETPRGALESLGAYGNLFRTHVKTIIDLPHLESRDFGAARLRALETHQSPVDVTYHGAETPRGWDSV